jgi:hypothetical protein
MGGPTAGEPAWQLDRSKPAVGPGDGRASALVEWEKLPSDLKSKLDPQLWASINNVQQRQTLIETYHRLQQYGLWDEVTKVVGEKNRPEAAMMVCAHGFKVPGNSGGIQFEARDGEEFVKKLIATEHFGKDGDVVSIFHQGQHSMREFSTTETSGLHVSVNKTGNRFDTHVDKFSPTDKPEHGKTKLDVAGSARHWNGEIIPEGIRKIFGLPGTSVDGGATHGDRENKWGWKIGIKVEGSWDGEQPKEPLRPPYQPTPVAGVDAATIERIHDRVDRLMGPNGMVPRNTPADMVDNYGDRRTVASDLAARVKYAAEHGERTVTIALGDLYVPVDQADRRDAAQEVERIGRAVVAEMGPDAGKVGGVNVVFGNAGNQHAEIKSVPVR